MKTIKHRSASILLQFVFAPCLLLGQCRATLSGRVIDEQGKPLADARVLTVELAPGPGHPISAFKTDAKGDFHGTVNIAEHGLYFLGADKESSGYPSAILSFYINHAPPEFLLKCNSSRFGIVLRVGPKAAYIQHISVLDADSAILIEDASIRLWRLTSPLRNLRQSELGITASTRLTPPTTKYSGLAVPSNVEIAYQISAPGYATSPVARIRLKPLEDFDITVKLRPASAKTH